MNIFVLLILGAGFILLVLYLVERYLPDWAKRELYNFFRGLFGGLK